MQQVIDIARTVGRKVAFVGRSMVDNVEIAHGLDYLHIPDGIVSGRRIFADSSPRNIVILASGTQAEPMSALSRIAVDNHRLSRLGRKRHRHSFLAHHSRKRKSDLPHA